MQESLLNSLATLSSTVIDKIKSMYESLMNSFFKKQATILFLGVDNAGKTTLVNKLKNNVNSMPLPTISLSKEEVEIGNLKAVLFDIGGHDTARMGWQNYFLNSSGIVFIVDVYDRTRFHKVAEAWSTVIECEKAAPILVIMNKIDMDNRTTESLVNDTEYKREIEEQTQISHLRNPNQHVKIIYLSVHTENVFNKKSTLREGFEWLSKNVIYH